MFRLNFQHSAWYHSIIPPLRGVGGCRKKTSWISADYCIKYIILTIDSHYKLSSVGFWTLSIFSFMKFINSSLFKEYFSFNNLSNIWEKPVKRDSLRKSNNSSVGSAVSLSVMATVIAIKSLELRKIYDIYSTCLNPIFADKYTK